MNNKIVIGWWKDWVDKQESDKFVLNSDKEVVGMIFTDEQTKYAKTIVPSSKELFVGFGVRNNKYGNKRFNFELTSGADYGMVISIGYYIIGKIQKSKEPFFKKNIVRYTSEASRVFGEKIFPIVEGGENEKISFE